MLSPDTKNTLKHNIEVLLKKIDNNEFYIHDPKLPSLNIWCFYGEFVNNVLVNYPLREADGWNKNNLEIFDVFELDFFFVNAHNPNDSETTKLKKHLNILINKLK